MSKAPATIFKKTLQEALIDGEKDIGSFCKDFLDFVPYDKQADFMQKTLPVIESDFVGGNRVGKSFSIGPLVLHAALYQLFTPFYGITRSPYAKYHVVITSITQAQAGIPFEYVNQRAQHKRFKSFLRGEATYSPHPVLELNVRDRFGNPAVSRIEARSLANRGVALLGMSLSRIFSDEVAFIPYYKEIEDTVLRMRLADQGGSLLRFSSPNGRNDFYASWRKNWHENAQPDKRYLSYRLTTYDNPFVPREFLEEQKARMRHELFLQNVMAEFIAITDFFGQDAITKLYADIEVEDTNFGKQPNSTAAYVMGIDLGFRRDSTVIQVAEVGEKASQIVEILELAQMSPDIVERRILATYDKFRPVQTVIDATGIGVPFVDGLIRQGMVNTEAFTFSAPTKVAVLTQLQNAVYKNEWSFPYTSATQKLVEQMSFYQLDDKRLTQDYVIAFALLNRAAEQFRLKGQFSTEIDDSISVYRFGADGSGYGDFSELPDGELFLF